MWLGDAASVLVGWEDGGQTRTTADRAFVDQGTSANVTSKLKNQDCWWQDNDQRVAEAVSLFVGIPHSGHDAVFRGPLSNRSYGIAGAGDYVSRSWDSTSTVDMARVDEGICYLSYLAGDFHETTDRALISIVATPTPRWRLRTRKDANNNSTTGIRAHARCYLYDQSQ
jgi:hypothetical protein